MSAKRIIKQTSTHIIYDDNTKETIEEYRKNNKSVNREVKKSTPIRDEAIKKIQKYDGGVTPYDLEGCTDEQLQMAKEQIEEAEENTKRGKK